MLIQCLYDSVPVENQHLYLIMRAVLVFNVAGVGCNNSGHEISLVFTPREVLEMLPYSNILLSFVILRLILASLE